MKIVLRILALAIMPWYAQANDYPTLERVDHVLTCMASKGGQTVDNLYACSCEIDIIAQEVPFDDFTEARTFEIYKRMPGEKGGLFRDSERAKKVVGQLEQARADATKRCFIGRKAQAKQVAPAAPASAAPIVPEASGTAVTPAPATR